MRTFSLTKLLAVLVLYSAMLIGGCRQSHVVPPPSVFTGYPQPDVVPLVLSDPQPLHWDTLSRTGIKPTVFPLDLSNMPSRPFDPTGFKPLSDAPAEKSFNFSALQSRPLDLQNIPGHKLEMKTDTLPAPAISKLPQPKQVVESAMDLKKWPQFPGGLNSMSIRGMVTDSTGTIWFSTYNGIFAYNGNEMAHYLPGVNTEGLGFDNKGNLWCMDISNWKQYTALLRIDFKNNTVGKAVIDSFSSGILNTFQLDGNGQIWIMGIALNTPPLLLNPSEMSYRELNAAGGFKSSRYYRPGIDEKNRIWLPSRNGIEVVDQKENKVYHIAQKDGLRDDTVANVLPAGGEAMWIATRSGVARINMATGKITDYRLIQTNTLYIWSMLLDQSGQLWIATPTSMYVLNPEDNTLRMGEEPDGLKNNSIIRLVQDKYGRIVLVAFEMNQDYGSVYSVGQFGKTVRPLADEGIICSAEDSRENLWIGTEQGVFIVDSARRRYWKLDPDHGLANNFIQYIGKNNDKIFVSTNSGYNVYDPQKNQLLRISRQEGLLTDTIYTITTDAHDNDWIAAFYSGLLKYDRVNKLLLRLNSKGGLNGDIVGQTSLLTNNRVMVASEEGGPSIINLQENTIQTLEKNPEIVASGSNRSIFKDSKGRSWIIMSSPLSRGLQMIDPDLKTVTHFTTKNGLASNSISSVLDYNGIIVVNANEKINILTPPELSSDNKWKVSVMAHSGGLKKGYNSYVSDAVTKRGEYLYGDKGLDIIYGLLPDTMSSQPYITRLSVMGKNMDFTAHSGEIETDTSQNNTLATSRLFNRAQSGKIRWDSISCPYHLGLNLSLPYNQNTVQFQFAEMNPTRPDEADYAYVLEGIDKQWSFTKNLHTESYLNLSSGHYTFKVAAKATSGRWGIPATYSFTIRPPWYGTWWAYAVYALLATVAVWFITHLQKKSAIAKERQRANIREAQLKADAENERRKNLEIISDMGRDITGSLSLKKIIDTVYAHVNTLMDASVLGIGIFDNEKNQLLFPGTKERGTSLPAYSYSPDDLTRPAVWSYLNQKEILSNDFETEYINYVPELAITAAGDHVKSLIYVPLIHKENCLGVLTAQSFNKDAYNDFHLNILKSLATYAAVAIDNAETYRGLQAAQNQLIQSEKMASLGELTAGIAHEIQNPLNFVNNFAEVSVELLGEMNEDLDKGEIGDAKNIAKIIRLNLEKINFHGKRADGIVKGMLQHSRGTTGQKEMTDINTLCDEYLRLSYHGLRAKDKSFNADFKSEFDPETGKINVVPQDIGRVVLNLLNNAFYAVNEKKKNLNGGFNPAVLISTKKLPGKVEISVKDNGSGIPKSLLEKIFQPFFSTKPTGNGTGLGLSLSYDIVKAHRGSINVESMENEGTTFTIELPS